MARYYICGQAGSGVEGDPYRPEIADDLEALVLGYVEVDTPDGLLTVPVTPSWAANQEIEAGLPPTPLQRFIVHVALPPILPSADDYDTEAEYAEAVAQAVADAVAFMDYVHSEVAYDKKTNPDGYDWIEVADDGTVTLHAA